MDRKSFAFDKTNFTLLGIGMVVIILGFIFMIYGILRKPKETSDININNNKEDIKE